VFAGSLGWWFCLSGVVSLARDHLSETFTTKVTRGTSYLLFAFGMAALGSAAYTLLK
jgi:putative LysE/RhtB family amino acid efflux pump